MTIVLRDYQQAAVDATFRYFERAKGNPLVVLPTGAGKSLVIAETIRRARQMHEGTRCLVLCHRKELVVQDAAALRLLGENPGIFSASLGERQVRDVTVAQYQSARMDPSVFGKVDLIFVDEVHLVPQDDRGTYRELLRAIPAAVVGMTATPYRLDGGRLTRGKDKLFSSIAYDLPVQRLVDAGHLVPVVTPHVSLGVDTASVKTRGGDFVQSDLDKPAQKITREALAEAKVLAKDRRAWLVFCVSVEHAKMAVAELMDLEFGRVALVTGETPADERDRIVKQFRAGEIRAVVNVDVLTTGFDAPICDCLVILRPTQSTGLYVQMVGRGMRTHPGKTSCLLLDYGTNVERHGPITAVNPKSQPAAPGEWVCEDCDAENSTRLRTCKECGAERFRWDCPNKDCEARVPASVVECPECGTPKPEAPREVAHETQASRSAAMGPPLEPAWIEVDDMGYWRHEKKGDDTKPPSLGVSYSRGGRTVAREWVCPEHGGFAAGKFEIWWKKRGGALPCPRTVDEAVKRHKELRKAVAVWLEQDGKWERVADVRLAPPREPGSDDGEGEQVEAETDAWTGEPVSAPAAWIDDDPLPF